MMKKFFLKFIILIIIMQLTFLTYRKEIQANDEITKVHLIFNRLSLDVGDTLSVKVSLDNFNNLYSSELMIKCDTDYLVPIKVNQQYFILPDNSLFNQKNNNDIITFNDFVDNKYLRINFYKGNNIEEGYQNGIFNGLVEINFVAKQAINRVSDYFKNENIYQNNTGVRLILTNTFGQAIHYQFDYSEKLKVNWSRESYEIEVFSNLPDFLNDIVILNRDENQYLLEAMTEEVNPNLIGIQVIKVKVFDIITNEIYYLAKPIKVIDLIPPEIIVEDLIYIQDIDILNHNFLFAMATDNYDANISVKATYYNEDDEELINLESFINYLGHHLTGKIIYTAEDQSGNQAAPKTANINIIDTTPPVINILDSINIIDQKLDSFIFDDYIVISDTYDQSPNFAFFVEDLYGAQYEDYYDLLLKDKKIVINYFGFDNQMNKTPVYKVNITLIDTTPPVISGIVDLEINDCDVDGYLFNAQMIITDNFDQNLSLTVTYRLNELTSEEVSYSNFIFHLYQGGIGYIEYQASDKAGNNSEKVFQKITVSDTLPPIITVNNLINGKKYFKVMPIDFDVVDNSTKEIIIAVYLNDEPYELSEITTVGLYTFKIIATDYSGNVSEKSIKFEIIKDDIISCGDDIKCYLQNYRTIVIIVGSILGLTVLITIVQIINRKKRNYQMAILMKK